MSNAQIRASEETGFVVAYTAIGALFVVAVVMAIYAVSL